MFDLDFLPCVFSQFCKKRQWERWCASALYKALLRELGKKSSFFLSTGSHFAFQYQFLRHQFFRKMTVKCTCKHKGIRSLFRQFVIVLGSEAFSSLNTCCNSSWNQIFRAQMTAICRTGQNKTIWKTAVTLDSSVLTHSKSCPGSCHHHPPKKKKATKNLSKIKTTKPTPKKTNQKNPNQSMQSCLFLGHTLGLM